ncbi:MAG: response regulator transcription factor [Ignavibacteriae bacterium]|nr:response regulator transcription factor [Ignavibacteriota bacterium]
MSNKKYLNKKIAEQILFVNEFDKPIQEKLSKREFQILQYCTEGISSKEIAEKLLISPKTVSTYRTRILQKLQIDNFAQMIYQLNIKEL